MNTSRKADVLLITVTAIETKAVLAVHQERTQGSPARIFIDDKTYFDLGLVGGAQVYLVRSEQGAIGIGASLQTVAAGIAALKPEAVVMLGIAFGIADRNQERQIGDILVARQLLLYEPQRIGRTAAGETDIRLRGDRTSASTRLLDRFWNGHLDWMGASIHFGLMLSGEKLIDHPDFLERLLTLEPEAIGGEMEGAGLYAAAQQQHANWILIKAISDWANGEKNLNKQEYQTRAARNAAEFVFHVVEQGGFAGPRDDIPDSPAPTVVEVPQSGLPSASAARDMLIEKTSSLRQLAPIRNRWALLVGVNDYTDPTIPDLNYSVHDVLGLEQVLTRLGYEVVYLHDQAAAEHRRPTRANILAELTHVCEAADQDDLVLVYFAGHGTLLDDQPVLLSSETRRSALAQSALPVAALESVMRSSRARRLVLLLDACHTGANIGRNLGDPEFLHNVYDLSEGFALIAASTAHQKAQEWEAQQHGVFTYYLLQGLEGKARDQHGQVTVQSLTLYVLDQLRRWRVQQSALLQEPTVRIDGLGDMVLVERQVRTFDVMIGPVQFSLRHDSGGWSWYLHNRSGDEISDLTLTLYPASTMYIAEKVHKIARLAPAKTSPGAKLSIHFQSAKPPAYQLRLMVSYRISGSVAPQRGEGVITLQLEEGV